MLVDSVAAFRRQVPLHNNVSVGAGYFILQLTTDSDSVGKMLVDVLELAAICIRINRGIK